MNYYQHNIGDFAFDTKYMNFEQKGIYIDLLDHYLATGKPLGSHWVATIKHLANEGAVDAVLEMCFVERDGLYYHEGCEKIIADYEAMSEKNRQNARRRKVEQQSGEGVEGNKDSKKATGKPLGSQSLASRSQPITINHKPITNKEKEINKEKDFSLASSKKTDQSISKPEDVSQTTWDEWVKYKKAKSKSLTQRMVDAIVREASKAHMTSEEAMVYQMEQGWNGFNAEWVANKHQSTKSLKNADVTEMDSWDAIYS
jgi:uncharacterized protein YdaU (DUF1376 family)